MKIIKNLSDGLEFSKQHQAVIVSGYEIKRENGSEECKAVFNISKKQLTGLLFADNCHKNEKIDSEWSFKTRNITLWNTINDCRNAFGRTILKSLYAFSFIFLLPVADQALGQLRADHQVVSFYKNNVDRFKESPIVHFSDVEVKLAGF